jgi:hypothetical protein
MLSPQVDRLSGQTLIRSACDPELAALVQAAQETPTPLHVGDLGLLPIVPLATNDVGARRCRTRKGSGSPIVWRTAAYRLIKRLLAKRKHRGSTRPLSSSPFTRSRTSSKSYAPLRSAMHDRLMAIAASGRRRHWSIPHAKTFKPNICTESSNTSGHKAATLTRVRDQALRRGVSGVDPISPQRPKLKNEGCGTCRFR